MKQRRTSRRRRIAVVTGTRAEYGLLQSTMRAITRHSRLRLHLIVTGMHLLRKFGHTVGEIKRDGWTINARVPMQSGSDKATDQATGLGKGIAGIAAFIEKESIDVVLVLGDRIEAMAGALAAVTTGRILAHVHGGDVAIGDFDDSLRHAITKLAHLHFPATQSAARRIIRMGENRKSVYCVGAPGLDDLGAMVRDRKGRASLTSKAIVLFHASGRPASRERQVMNAILSETARAGLARIVIYPNSDRGHEGVVSAIEWHAKSNEHGDVEVFKSLARSEYLRRLMDADLLIGNSSSGIIEAATAGTAVVNVGDRQKGRQRAGKSVIDAHETATSIRRAIAQALRTRPIIGKKTAYGDGTAGSQIASILASVKLDDSLRRKQCAY